MKNRSKWLIVFVTILLMSVGMVACGDKTIEFTLDREEGVIEMPLGKTFMPDTYVILANGKDSGLKAKVQSVVGPDGENVPLRSGSLTLSKSGNYILTYRSEGLKSTYNTEEMTWAVTVHSSDKTGPQVNGVTYGADYSVVWVGKTVPQPEISATDNSDVDWTSAKVHVRLPDGTRAEVPVNGSFTPSVTGTHTWEYSLADTVGNVSVYEYSFNVIAGPAAEKTDVIGYFDQQFGIEQIQSFNSNAALDADFVWKDLAGMPKGAVRLTQTADQWTMQGTQYLGVGLDGTMQVELYGPYIEDVADKYDVLYLPMYNPNDFPIQVRVWFDDVMLIPAHETAYYSFSAQNYRPGSEVEMMQGDYTVIQDVYRTTFSCGPENGTYFDFAETLDITDEKLTDYYAETRGVTKEEAAEAVGNMTDWAVKNELVMEYVNNAMTVDQVLSVLKPHMFAAGTEWVIGPLMGAKFENKDTASEKYVADLGNVGATSHVVSYGDRALKFTDADEFTDEAKGIEGAVLYSAGDKYVGLDSGCELRLTDLNYTRYDLSVMMGKDDYISLWLKKPQSCTVDFKVEFGWGAYSFEPTEEWQEIRLQRKPLGTVEGGKDGLEYLFLDSGYEADGEWVETYPEDIVIRILNMEGKPVYDGVQLAIAGVKLVLTGDPAAERFNLSGINENDYAAVWTGRELPVPQFTSSYEASGSGMTVTQKNVYVQIDGGEKQLVTGDVYTPQSAGGYKWIFETYGTDRDGKTGVLSSHEYAFTVYDVPETLGTVIFDSELGVKQVTDYNGDVEFDESVRYEGQNGTIKLTTTAPVRVGDTPSVVDNWAGITFSYPYISTVEGYDYIEIPVYNASSATLSIGLLWGECVSVAPGTWALIRVKTETIKAGVYTLASWGNTVNDLPGFSVAFTTPWNDPEVPAGAVVHFGAAVLKNYPEKPADGGDKLVYLDSEYGSVVEASGYKGILSYMTEIKTDGQAGSACLTLNEDILKYWVSEEDYSDEFAGIILSAPSHTDLGAYTHILVPVYNGSSVPILAGEMWGDNIEIAPGEWGYYKLSTAKIAEGVYTLAAIGDKTNTLVNLSVAVCPAGDSKEIALAKGSRIYFGAVVGLRLSSDQLVSLDYGFGSGQITAYGGTTEYANDVRYGGQKGSTGLVLNKSVENYWISGDDFKDEFAGIILTAPSYTDLSAFDYISVPVYNAAKIDICVGQMWSDNMLTVKPGEWGVYTVPVSTIWSGDNKTLDPWGGQTWSLNGFSIAVRPTQVKGQKLNAGDKIYFGAITGVRNEGTYTGVTYENNWTAKGGSAAVSEGGRSVVFTVDKADTAGDHVVGINAVDAADYDYVRVTVRNLGTHGVNFWLYDDFEPGWWPLDPGDAKTIKIDKSVIGRFKDVNGTALVSLNGLAVKITDKDSWGNDFTAHDRVAVEVSYTLVKTNSQNQMPA